MEEVWDLAFNPKILLILKIMVKDYPPERITSVNPNFDFKNYFPKNLKAAPQKPSSQLNFRSNFSSTCTENSNISLLMIKNRSI